MIFTETKLKGAFVIDLEKKGDARGFFARTFCRKEFETKGLKTQIAQANLSHNLVKGTLRGMHFQCDPFQEVKIISCPRGAIFDVIIDLRKKSSTYRQWIGVELSEDNHRMLYVPEDFAHGYLTLRDDTSTAYFVTQFYAPNSELGVRYNDPAYGIQWPAKVVPRMVTDKDRNWPDYEG